MEGKIKIGTRTPYWEVMSNEGYLTLKCIHSCYSSPYHITLGIKFDGQWYMHDSNKVHREYYENLNSIPVEKVDDHWEGYDLPLLIDMLKDAKELAYLNFGQDNFLDW